MSIVDPVAEMRGAIRAFLGKSGTPASAIVDDAQIGANVRWRPHVWDDVEQRAWHCATEDADPDSWLSRMRRARTTRPHLRLGVCASTTVISQALDQLDELEAAILVVPGADEGVERVATTRSASVCDFIYEHRMALDPYLARGILDRNYARALAANSSKDKGVLLELVAAVVLSQVTGYHIGQKDISNRSQQMDVLVINRNASGVLSGGAVVIVEVKNWTNPVTPTEYYSLMRKVETRHGRSKLGVLITSGRFTQGIENESTRDSSKDVMILRLDGTTFPALWREGASITDQYEQRMMESIAGQ